MTHDPGRERHMTYRCEHCWKVAEESELHMARSADELWCESCLDNEAEVAYERQQAADLESPPESAREEQLRTWEEKQKAHKR